MSYVKRISIKLGKTKKVKRLSPTTTNTKFTMNNKILSEMQYSLVFRVTRSKRHQFTGSNTDSQKENYPKGQISPWGSLKDPDSIPNLLLVLYK